MNVAASPPPPPLSGDPHGQDAGVPFTQKVGRYSAEERKEKIERYRTKRNQRNFHKKITVMISRTTQSANAISMFACPLMHLLLRTSSVCLQEDAGGQQAQGAGPLREECRDRGRGCCRPREGGLRQQQLRALSLQRPHHHHQQQQQLLLRHPVQGKWQNHNI